MEIKLENMELIFREGCNLKNMGSTSDNLEPKLTIQDVGNSILARDYKGLGNWNSNGVIEIWKLKN